MKLTVVPKLQWTQITRTNNNSISYLVQTDRSQTRTNVAYISNHTKIKDDYGCQNNSTYHLVMRQRLIPI